MIPNLAKPSIDWDISKKIFIKENVFSDELCDKIIRFGETNVQKGVDKYPHLFTTSFHSCLLPLENEAHIALQDALAETIDFFKIDIDFVEPYELKKYTTADYFGSHIDNYYSIKENIDRKITMVVQLSDETTYSGGDLSLLGKIANRKKGSITAFPSFFPHQVTKLDTGERWSLIAWLWGPYWK